MKGPDSFAEKAYHTIKRMLLTDELVGGQKILYRDMADKLGMSQTPVILALTRLKDEGLIRSETNKGFSVPELDLEEARELYEIRTVLEEFLIKRSAKLITDEQLKMLRGLMEQHQALRGEVYCRERLWNDARLHLAIASFANHPTGEHFLRQICDRIYLRYRPDRMPVVRLLEAEQEHEQIYNALADRDSAKAARMMRRHLKQGLQRILEGLRHKSQQRQALTLWD